MASTSLGRKIGQLEKAGVISAMEADSLRAADQVLAAFLDTALLRAEDPSDISRQLDCLRCRADNRHDFHGALNQYERLSVAVRLTKRCNRCGTKRWQGWSSSGRRDRYQYEHSAAYESSRIPGFSPSDYTTLLERRYLEAQVLALFQQGIEAADNQTATVTPLRTARG